METLKIKPGSFLLWKEHSRITKLFSKLFHKELPYNNFSFFLREIELCFPITKGNNNYGKLIILEPKEDYTKEEINLLNSLVIFDANDYFDTVKIFANTLRPNSIDSSSNPNDLLWNENYKIAYDFSKKN